MKRTLILVITLFITVFVYSNEIIKFEDYINTISEKLPGIKLNENEVRAQELEVNKSYSAFDLNADAGFYGMGSQTYSDNENTINNYSPGFGSNLTFSNTLPSGTRLSAGLTYQQKYTSGEITSENYTTGNESTSSWEKVSYEPVLSVGVTQPLLYNWFGFLDRYGVKNEKNLLVIEKITRELNNISILNDYKKLYFQWIALIYKLELIEKTIANAKLQYAQTKTKVELGLLEQDSLETTNYSLLQYEKQKKEYLISYEQLKNQLSFFFDIDEYEPDRAFFNDLYNEYLEKDFEYIDFDTTKNAQIINLTRENYELLKKARTNQAMPQLDLFANIDFNFRYIREVDDGEVNIYTFNDNNYSNVDFTAGIEFSFPIGNIEARNNIKEAQLLIENVLLQYEETKQTYDYNLLNVISYDEYVKALVVITNRSIRSLSNKYMIQQDQYKKGITELQDVVETENSITSEKMNEIDIKVNLINNITDYYYLTE